MTVRQLRGWLAASLLGGAALLTACGGGGGDDGDTSVVTPTPTAPGTSQWTMDAHTYVNGGHSAQSSATIGDTVHTVVVVSTATTSGGDTANGAFSGSALTFTFPRGEAGTYTVVGDRAAYLAAAALTKVIHVQSNVGIAVTTGATLYTATTGQVVVTRDSAGTLHFSTSAPVRTEKTLEVQGGVDDAPATMTLTVTDAY